MDSTISGGITINGGEIKVDAASRLGGATSITVNGSSQAANRAGLQFTHTTGTQTLATPVTVNAGTVSISAAGGGILQVNSNISGSGGVTYTGPGSFIVAGAKTYSGPTFLTSGLLAVVSDSAFGSSADPQAGFVSFAGGAVQPNAAWISARAIHVSTNGSLFMASPVNWSGPVTGTGTLFKYNTGTITITSGVDNGFSGTLSIGSGSPVPGGTVVFSGGGALNAASVTFGASSGGAAGTYALNLSGAADIDPADGSSRPWRSINALTTTSGFTFAHSILLGGSAGAPVDLRVSSGTFGQGTAPTGTGVVTGFGKLIKTGTGTLTLANPDTTTNNTFTGGVEIWGGTLAFSADNQLGDASNGIVIKGGILNNTASVATSRGITLGATPQPIISAAAVVTLNNGINVATSTTLTLNGSITGPGGFNKSGTGQLTLGASSNSYAGDTQISQGTLAFTDNNQLGGGTSRIRLNGGTLSDIAASGTQTINRTIIIPSSGGSFTVSNAAATMDIAGPLLNPSGTSNTKTGAGALTISGDNFSFFGALTIGDGTNATGTVTLASTGQMRRSLIFMASAAAATFDMSNLTRELGGLTFNSGNTIQLGSNGKLTAGFNNQVTGISGTIAGGGSASFTKAGTNTFTLGGTFGSGFGGGIHLLSGATTFSGGDNQVPLQSGVTLGGWGSSANAGPSLTIASTTNNFGNRIADTQAIHSNAGTLVFSANTTAASSESIGSLRGAGMSTVTMTTGGTLNFADATNGLARIGRGTFLFRAGNANMGSAAATTVIANLTFGNNIAGQLIGGGGAAGTTTISILPYAVGGITASDTGSNFVTYGANGVRVLNTTTEVAPFLFSAGTTDNLRLNAPTQTSYNIVTAGDQTLNSLSTGGGNNTVRIESIGGHKLILTSGLLLNTANNVWTTNTAGTAAIILGMQMPEIQTGAGNTSELNVFTTGGDLAIGAKITTTGGFTKSGAANLYLTNTTNTYTGATTINAGSLVIDGKAALGGSTTLQMGGGFLKYRGGDTTLTGIGIVTAGGEAANPNGGSAGFHIVSGTTLTAANGSVSGYGGILKDGTGVLKLTGTNTNSGATIISGGALAIDGAAALGTNGRVIFADGISTAGGQTLRFDANNITLTQDFITNTAQANIGFGFDTNGNNATLSGTILSTTSTRGLYKFGAGELNLTATEMYTGPTQIFGGTLRLSGANGSILNSTGNAGFNTTGTVFINQGAALVLDNSVVNNSNRLPDVWDTPFGSGNAASGTLRMNGGEFKVIGNASGTQERINQFDVSFGTITLQNGGTQIVSGLFNRTGTTSAGLIRGDNLGSLPSATSTNWFVTDLGGGGVQLNGAGGAEGTPFVNILRGFAGATSATGTGADLVTYAADTGFRTLAANEYSGTIAANNFYSSRAANIALNGAATIDQTTAINALKLGAGASIGGTGSLVLFNSTVLATGTASISTPMLSSNVSGSNADLIFLTSGGGTVLTVDSAVAGGALVKYGDGVLQLNGRYLGGTGVTVAEGTLKLGASGALNPIGASVFIHPGATFDLNGSDRIIASFNTTGIIGTFGMSRAGDGTVALGPNRLTIYDSSGGLFSGSITGTGGLTISYPLTNSDYFTQPLSYTGSTVIRGGNLVLVGAGTLASSSVELRGGNLAFLNTDENAAAGGTIANRIGTGTPIMLAGGNISFNENANTPANHNLGAVTLAGGGRLTITNGTAAPSTTTIANLIRGGSNTGTPTITATNLGLAQSSTGNARVFATQINGAAPASAFIGGGGAVGTTTQNILPWAWSSTANSFLTYVADGFRPLVTGSEYAPSLATSTANDNVRIAASATLGASAVANSLIVSGSNISGAFDLTLTSGALAVVGASDIGATTNALLSGAGNTRELIISNTAGTALRYNLSTAGGVTKFGAGALTLSGTNTFTGGLAINEGTVSFSSDSQLGAAGGAVRFGGIAGTPATFIYTATGALAFNRPIETVSIGSFSITNSNTRVQINQPITGAGGIQFASGIFELNAASTYAGPTHLLNVKVYFGGDSALGNGGEILLTNSTIVQRGDWTSSRLIHFANSGSSINTNGYNATFSGLVAGNVGFGKTGNGSLTITEAMPAGSSPFVSAGALVLKDRGSFASASAGIGAGGTLTLDDRGVHFPDRLGDTRTVSMNGGHLNVIGSGSVTTEEVVGSFAIASGANTFTLAPGSGQAAILRIAGSVTNASGAATLFRGTNLGVNAPGSANSASILLTDVAKQIAGAFAITGGGAPAGSPSISIISGAFGDISVTGLGTQLVTYDLDKGVRLLNPATEFTTALADGSVVTDNIKADGATITLTSTGTTANALWLKDGGSLAGAGKLTLSAATLLVTGSGNSISAILDSGGNALAIGGPGDVTFNTDNGLSAAGIVKMGAGTVTLNASNLLSGNSILAAGIVNIGNASSLGFTPMEFQGGEIRNSSAGPLTVTNSLTLNGAMSVGGAQDLTFSGTVSLANATRTVNVTNTGTTTLSGVVSSSTANVNYGLTKTGAGMLVLSNAANSYDGATTVSGGTLQVSTLANGGGNSGIGKGFADADKLVLNGGTLKYTGGAVSTDRLFTITQNGGTLDASGSGNLAFTNTGNVAVTGPGARTLALKGGAATSNVLAAKLTDGPTAADKLSVTVSTTKWTLTNANTHTGTTTVTGSTLALGGTGSFANSPGIQLTSPAAVLDISGVTGGANHDGTRFTLTSGQTLSGSGSVVGALSISSGAVIAPFFGTNENTLSTQDVFFTAAGSTFRPLVNFAGTSIADLLNVTGGVSLAGSTLDLTAVLNTASLAGSQTFLLVQNDLTDAVSGIFGSILTPSGISASVNYTYTGTDALGRVGDGNDIAVIFAPGTVPEPGALTLLLASLPLLAARRRRRA